MNRRVVGLSSKTKRTLGVDNGQLKGCSDVNDEEEEEARARRPPSGSNGKWQRPCAELGLPWVEPSLKTAAYVFI